MVRNTDRLEVGCVGAGGACGLLMLVTTNMRHYLAVSKQRINAVLVVESAKMIVGGGVFVGVNSCQDPFLTTPGRSLDSGRAATKRSPRKCLVFKSPWGSFRVHGRRHTKHVLCPVYIAAFSCVLCDRRRGLLESKPSCS